MEEVTFNGLTWVRKQEYINLSRRLTEAIAALNDEKAGRPLLAKATDKINELEAKLARVIGENTLLMAKFFSKTGEPIPGVLWSLAERLDGSEAEIERLKSVIASYSEGE